MAKYQRPVCLLTKMAIPLYTVDIDQIPQLLTDLPPWEDQFSP